MNTVDISKINWTVVCVGEFARYKEVDIKTAFQYLNEFGGIMFLKEHYEAEHVLSLEETVEDLELICAKNGGHL
jgi:hypothetical protein